MLKIAICDDQADELHEVIAQTQCYCDCAGIAADIMSFGHPDDLLTACETRQFHIYLLDVVMPMVNGVDIGIALRRYDRDAQIIYITKDPAFALASFSVNPLGYLLKPLVKENLFKLLTLACNRVRLDEGHFPVQTSEGLFSVPFGDILCCTLHQHSVRFLLGDGTVHTTRAIRVPFAQYAAPLLADSRFFKANPGSLVNLAKVLRLKEGVFYLPYGMTVPVSQKHRAEAFDAFMDYTLGRPKGTL
jgi:two-component system LytT family response regulator